LEVEMRLIVALLLIAIVDGVVTILTGVKIAGSSVAVSLFYWGLTAAGILGGWVLFSPAAGEPKEPVQGHQ
jgi:hypothetical protein